MALFRRSYYYFISFYWIVFTQDRAYIEILKHNETTLKELVSTLVNGCNWKFIPPTKIVCWFALK